MGKRKTLNRKKYFSDLDKLIHSEAEKKYHELQSKGSHFANLENIERSLRKESYDLMQSETNNNNESFFKGMELLKSDYQDLWDKIEKEIKKFMDKKQISIEKEEDFIENKETLDKFKLNKNICKLIHKEALNLLEEESYQNSYLLSNILCLFHPEDVDFQYLRAILLMNTGDVEKAIQYLSAIAEMFPGYEYAYLSIIECLIMKNDMKSAEEVYNDFEECFNTRRELFTDPDFLEEKLHEMKNIIFS